MKRRVAVRGIVVLDNKLLCVKLKAYDGKPATDYWCLPGGGVDPGEPLLPALTREMVEETGVIPKIGNLVYVQQFIHNGSEQMELFFHITNAKDYKNIDVTKASHGPTEIDKLDFINPTKHYVLPELLATESFDSLATQPPKIFNYI